MFYLKSLNQNWSNMGISDDVFSVMSQHTNRKWKIDGDLVYPNFDDVQRLIEAMANDIRTAGYDSIESGGILVKKDGDKIDVYVHIGELDEDSSV